MEELEVCKKEIIEIIDEKDFSQEDQSENLKSKLKELSSLTKRETIGFKEKGREVNVDKALIEMEEKIKILGNILPRLCVFTANKTYQNFVNYLINWIIYFYDDLPLPVYISDCSVDIRRLSPMDALVENFIEKFKSNPNTSIDRDSLTECLETMLRRAPGCIMLFRMDIPNKESFQEEMETILKQFDALPAYVMDSIKYPSFIFFINEAEVGCPSQWYSNSKSLSFSKHIPLIESEIEEWGNNLINFKNPGILSFLEYYKILIDFVRNWQKNVLQSLLKRFVFI